MGGASPCNSRSVRIAVQRAVGFVLSSRMISSRIPIISSVATDVPFSVAVVAAVGAVGVFQATGCTNRRCQEPETGAQRSLAAFSRVSRVDGRALRPPPLTVPQKTATLTPMSGDGASSLRLPIP